MLGSILAISTLLTVSPVTVEDVEFLGFSADERLAAWRLVLVEPIGARRIRYPLVQVLAMGDLHPVAEFRDGAAEDVATGDLMPPRRCPSARWRRAKGLSAWKRFAAAREIGLSPGADVSESARAEVQRGYLDSRRGSLVFRGQQGLAFIIRMDLANGETLHLGRFGNERAIAGRLRVYASPSGHNLAVECTLELADGERRGEPVLRRLTSFPLRARPEAGPVDADRVRAIFGEDTWGLSSKSGAKG